MHRRASLNRLKDEILRPVRPPNLVVTDGTPGFDVDRELLEAVDAIDHTPFNADPGIARFALRSVPVTATAALVNWQRVCADVVPFQSDQFADAQTVPNGHENHAGVGLRDQIKRLFEQLRSDIMQSLTRARMAMVSFIPGHSSNPRWTQRQSVLFR